MTRGPRRPAARRSTASAQRRPPTGPCGRAGRGPCRRGRAGEDGDGKRVEASKGCSSCLESQARAGRREDARAGGRVDRRVQAYVAAGNLPVGRALPGRSGVLASEGVAGYTETAGVAECPTLCASGGHAELVAEIETLHSTSLSYGQHMFLGIRWHMNHVWSTKATMGWRMWGEILGTAEAR